MEPRQGDNFFELLNEGKQGGHGHLPHGEREPKVGDGELRDRAAQDLGDLKGLLLRAANWGTRALAEVRVHIGDFFRRTEESHA